MLAKLTSRNQLTLPEAVMSAVEGSEYLDVTEENGRIVLTSVRMSRADAVSAKLADRRLFRLDDERWQAFQDVLDRPVADKPRLARMLAGKSALE